MKIAAVLSLIVLPLLTGCGITIPIKKSESKLSNLRLGASKTEIQETMGPADRVRASTLLPNGKTFELDEYEIYPNRQGIRNAFFCPLTVTIKCWFPGDHQDYWLQYSDGKLEKWGQAGDWKTDAMPDITIKQKE